MIKDDKLLRPNPVFYRAQTEILDGKWDFFSEQTGSSVINVPFCPQSKLSGIGYSGIIKTCEYSTTFTAEKVAGERLFLHFGAVDHKAVLFINGKYVGMHIGGFTPFSFDITEFLTGQNLLKLCVYDDDEDIMFRGKQTKKETSYGCFYTRTIGIWQSVWTERVPDTYIKKVFFTPDIKNQAVNVKLFTEGKGDYSVHVLFNGKDVGESSGFAAYSTEFTIPLSESRLWDIDKGDLYDVVIRFNGDEVFSYFGLREAGYSGYDFLVNGRKVFQKLVLDQGFYKDGLYTAPDVSAMENDILIAKRLGFNGARLHQKVFDPKFLYLCDKAGYMVWGEFPSWGGDCTSLDCLGKFIAEWTETLNRDFNHPSIITWCPLNEEWAGFDGSGKKVDYRFIERIFEFTKSFDNTRPVVDVSGGFHTANTDLFDFHCYAEPAELKRYINDFSVNGRLYVPLLYPDFENGYDFTPYSAVLPVNLSEFGGKTLGAGFSSASADGGGEVKNKSEWGYGQGASNADEFINYYEKLVKTVFAEPKISGFCYTQLYDIEQEQNGLYYYDRTDKFSDEQKDKIMELNRQK